MKAAYVQVSLRAADSYITTIPTVDKNTCELQQNRHTFAQYSKRPLEAMLDSKHMTTFKQKQRPGWYLNWDCFMGFVLLAYLVGSSTIFLLHANRRQLRAETRQSISDLSAINLEVCVMTGVRRSFMRLFPGMNLDTMEFAIREILRGNTNFSEQISREERDILFSALKSEPFQQMYENFIISQRRMFTPVGKDNSLPVSTVGPNIFIREEGAEDLNTVTKKLEALPYLKSSGAFDDEEVINSLRYDTIIEKLTTRVSRVHTLTKARVCHNIMRYAKDNLFTYLNNNTGRLVMDTEAYDTMQNSRFLPSLSVALLNAADSRQLVLLPGSMLLLDVIADPLYADYDDVVKPPVDFEYVFMDLNVTKLDYFRFDALSNFEMCRLYRQLSKRCQEKDVRRAILDEKYPQMCTNEHLRDFFPMFRFNNCVEYGPDSISSSLPHVVEQYAKENLALIDLTVNIFPYEDKD